MIPSSRWFPSSLQERAAWFDNFKTQFAVVAVNLGFTPTDVSGVTDDNSVFQFLAQTAVALDAYKEAVRQYRIILTEENVGDPSPTFPANPTFTPPVVGASTGIFERLDDLVKRIRVAPGYTAETGALLGILPSKPSGIAPDQMQPTLKAISLPGSVVQVGFVRGDTDGVIVETKIDNAGTWAEAGRYFKSPAELNIPANAQNLPRSVQMRARYIDGNTPVGQYSSVITTATQPEG